MPSRPQEAIRVISVASVDASRRREAFRTATTSRILKECLGDRFRALLEPAENPLKILRDACASR
jgi:hypothetical protein